MSDDEFFAKLDAMKSDRTKKRIREISGQTADELFQIAISKSTKKTGDND